LREFVAVDPELFPPDVFRDFVDDSDTVVHSLGAFLTVWSSVATLEEANAAATEPQSPPEEKDDEQKDGEEDQKDEDDPGSGQDQGNGQEQPAQNGEQEEDEPPPGWAINVNTAPGAVLHSLMEDRDLPYRFWDDVVLYRNTEDEAVEENDDPPKDEYGQDILVHQYFHSVDELSNVDGWENLEPIVKGELKALLKTESQVFSIYITARKPTGEEQINPSAREEDIEREEENWSGLVRTVRAVVWRRSLGEGEVEIVPLVRWEVLDYAPYEVLDFPETRRAGSR